MGHLYHTYHPSPDHSMTIREDGAESKAGQECYEMTLWAWHGCSTQELTTAVLTSTGLAGERVSQHSRRRGEEFTRLSHSWRTVGNPVQLMRGRVIFLQECVCCYVTQAPWMAPQSCACRQFQPESMGSKKKRQEGRKRKCQGNPGEQPGGFLLDMIKIHCIHV